MAALSDVTTPIASYHHGEFAISALCALKGDKVVSVCIPARNEQATLGPIVECVRRELVDTTGLVDELIVVDDGSFDETALVAGRAGARVVSVPSPADSGAGKGQAMRLGLAESRGDLVVFLDGDVESFGAHFVTGLLGPVMSRSETMLVKACYRRPLGDSPTGGGRVTELVARPLLSLLFPELSGVVQPLAGEVAMRREALKDLELAAGYGVEMGMLIDISRRYGPGAVVQVDLDVRTHRNRPLHELAPQARAVLDIALSRAGVQIA
jgi:glucosyl-3-phosphoglycerate synthase